MNRALPVRSRTPEQAKLAREYGAAPVAMVRAGSAACNPRLRTGWWDRRPIDAIRDLGLDERLEPCLGTPLLAACRAGASNPSGAAGEALAPGFPHDAKMWRARAVRAGISRLWGGVHRRIDVEQGPKMGRQVAGRVVRRAEQDGAEA